MFRLLLGELRTQTMLHDLRGALGAALGWAELSALEGASPSPGLMEALSTMQDQLSSLGPWWSADELAICDLATFAAEHTGLTIEGGPALASFRHEALGPCLSWAKPSQVSVLAATDPTSQAGMASLHLRGLCPQGVSVALHPDLAEIKKAEAEGLRTIATMALRCVARGGVGSIRSPQPDELILNLRRGDVPL
jgi:hypothetical protein